MYRLTFSGNDAPALPGAGRNEFAPRSEFPYLDKTFRSYLANNHVAKFRSSLSDILIDGVKATWSTIDHALVAAKFLYLSEICKDKERSALLRKTGLRFCDAGDLGGKPAKHFRNVVLLTNDESARWVTVREYAAGVITAQAFHQCDERMRVLRNTGDAKLFYTYVVGRKRLYVRATHLESARSTART